MNKKDLQKQKQELLNKAKEVQEQIKQQELLEKQAEKAEKKEAMKTVEAKFREALTQFLPEHQKIKNKRNQLFSQLESLKNEMIALADKTGIPIDLSNDDMWRKYMPKSFFELYLHDKRKAPYAEYQDLEIFREISSEMNYDEETFVVCPGWHSSVNC